MMSGRLLRGEELPEVGEIGQAILDAERRTAIRAREAQLLNTVRDELRGMREMALRSGSGTAFAWLGTQLDTLLDRGRAILRQLGTVRTFEAALDSEDPVSARDQLRALRALSVEYGTLREAQVLLVGTVNDAQRQGQSYAWSDQVALVNAHGLIANPQVVGQPPADPYDQLVWLLSRSPAPQAFVPDFRQLLQRSSADAARPAAQSPTPRGLAGASSGCSESEHKSRCRATEITTREDNRGTHRETPTPLMGARTDPRWREHRLRPRRSSAAVGRRADRRALLGGRWD